MKAQRQIWIGILGIALLIAAGCAGGSGNEEGPSTQNVNQPTPTKPVTEPTTTEPTTPQPETVYLLSFVDSATLTLEYEAQTQVAVRFTRNGQPYANHTIRFQLKGEVGSLLVAEATTDAQGIAAVTLKAGDKKGSGTIIASDSQQLTASAERLFSIMPRPMANLDVKIDYSGDRTPKTIEVVLLDADVNNAPSCDSIDFEQLPQDAKTRNLSQTDQTASFSDLKNGTTVMVVAVAVNEKGYALANGCHAQLVTIDEGHDVTITLNMDEIAPSYAGEFQTIYQLDLITSLPPEVKQTVETVVNTIQNPGNQLVTWICELEQLESVCSSSIVKAVVSDVITSLIESLLKKNPQLSSLYFGANDITEILKKFKLKSTLELDTEPDDQGNFNGDNRETLTHMIYRWTYQAGCDVENQSCGVTEMTLKGSGIQSTPVDVDARVRSLFSVDIEPHAFAFSYGQLLATLVERVVLPRVMGDNNINSFENFFYELLGGQGCLAYGKSYCCSNFGYDAALSTDWSSILPVESLATLACDLVVPYGAGKLRDQFKKLDPEGLDGLVVGTPAKGSCKLFDTDGVQQVDRIASETSPCQLDAKIKIGDTYYPISGSFFSTRRTNL